MNQRKMPDSVEQKTKIVIGNGFDLFCGLKTTYNDFFSYYSGKYEYLSKWIDEAASVLLQNPHLKNDPFCLMVPVQRIQLINCWDVFFSMVTDRNRERFWCDIETEMLDSFSKRDSDVENDYWPHWEDVWDFVKKKNGAGSKVGSILLGEFFVKKYGGIPETKEAFYEFLLEQLREFEGYFGRFIVRQHVAWNCFAYEYNKAYIANANSLLKQFCDPDEITSIDCFNYAFTPDSRFYGKCQFVNGDCLNPIFGIDSVFEPSDPRYIFTKTNRRIEWVMDRGPKDREDDFDNVVVFGHSLNQHDYNYFFPILDKLEMTDFLSKKKLVIAYSIYDERKAFGIKKGLRKAIYSLFTAYAKYCGKAEQPNRLLDSLTTQNRARIVEVSKTSASTNGFFEKADFWSDELSKNAISERWNRYVDWGREVR